MRYLVLNSDWLSVRQVPYHLYYLVLEKFSHCKIHLNNEALSTKWACLLAEGSKGFLTAYELNYGILDQS